MKINSLIKAMGSWKVIGFGFLVMGLMIFGGANLSYAGDTKVTGYGDLIYQAMNSEGGAGSGERQFSVDGEVDIEMEMNASVGVRIDIDLIGIAGGGVETFALVGEQLRFDWMLPKMGDVGLTVTGGLFNSPIGFEAQDAPDLLQVSHGLLFNLVPTNLAGVMFSGGMDMVNLSLLAANPHRPVVPATVDENVLGAVLTLTPMEDVSVTVSGLVQPENKGAGDKDVLNVVAQTTMIPNTLLAVEYTLDDNNRGVGVVANMTHEADIPHWLTVRWNGVWSDAGSAFATGTPFGVLNCAANKCDHNLYTAAVGAEFVSGLATILEYSLLQGEEDVTGVNEESHQILLEAVFTF